MDLERTLTSREEINAALRGVLDEATGKWGIRVNRVELKIEPPTSIQDSMEKQMRADRDKRAAILTAEGIRQSQILHGGGREAVGDPPRGGRGEGRGPAREGRGAGHPHGLRVHPTRSDPDQKLPRTSTSRCSKIAEGDANKLWIVLSEIGDALRACPARSATSRPDGGRWSGPCRP